MPYFLVFIFGILLGSFTNVVISRGPVWWKLAPSAHTDGPILSGPRSRCPACGVQLKAWHLIPLLSWVALRGKCSACGAPIALRYPLVELAGGLLAVAAVMLWGWSAGAAVAFVAALLLLALGVIDLETGYLPDALSLPLILLGLGANMTGMFAPFVDALIGAVAGYGVLALIRLFYLRVRGIEGLGLGDAKMLAGAGALLGWTALPFIALIASAAGLAAIGLLALGGQKVGRETPVRFGPFLALGTLIMLGIGAVSAPPGAYGLFVIGG